MIRGAAYPVTATELGPAQSSTMYLGSQRKMFGKQDEWLAQRGKSDTNLTPVERPNSCLQKLKSHEREHNKRRWTWLVHGLMSSMVG